MGEVIGGWSTKFGDVVVGADFEKFNAKEVGLEIAEIFDRVALDDARADAKGTFLRGRAHYAERLGFFFVTDPDRAGVVEIDEDGGCIGMVMDRNFLVRTVVDADYFEGSVFEDGFVVRWQCAGVLLGKGTERGQACEQRCSEEVNGEMMCGFTHEFIKP